MPAIAAYLASRKPREQMMACATALCGQTRSRVHRSEPIGSCRAALTRRQKRARVRFQPSSANPDAAQPPSPRRPNAPDEGATREGEARPDDRVPEREARAPERQAIAREVVADHEAIVKGGPVVVKGGSVAERCPVAERRTGGGHRDCRRAEDRDRGKCDDRFAHHVLPPSCILGFGCHSGFCMRSSGPRIRSLNWVVELGS